MKFLQKLNININKSLLLAFAGLGVAVLLIQLLSAPSPENKDLDMASEVFDVDTVIPAGHLLIPIQLSNAESLSSLTGSYSLVDLYASSEKGRKGFKVASSLKLLRAPLNPEQFAVLVREEDSAKIVTQEGPFFVALKNPKENPGKVPKKVVKAPLTIHYGE